jgi:phage/plasmid-associated DNA primase
MTRIISIHYIPLDDFKAVLGVDDREDKLARFCLVTSTLTIEQYCKRRLLRKKHFEQIEFCGDLVLPLREYPVSKMLAVYVLGNGELGVESGGHIKKMYKAYSGWCEENNEHPVSERFFTLRLKEMSFGQNRTSTERFWVGVGLESGK